MRGAGQTNQQHCDQQHQFLHHSLQSMLNRGMQWERWIFWHHPDGENGLGLIGPEGHAQHIVIKIRRI